MARKPSHFSGSQAEEQPGFKLASQNAPMEFLVIDHVERPAEN